MKSFKRKILSLLLFILLLTTSSCALNIANPFYISPLEDNNETNNEKDNNNDNNDQTITDDKSNNDSSGLENNTNNGSNDLENNNNNNDNDNSNDLGNKDDNDDNSNDLGNEDDEFGGSSTLEGNNNNSHSVHFVLNNGSANVTISVVDGTDTLEGKPSNPSKEGFIFDCWCSDSDLTTEYDFSTDIKEETYIYARYLVDYEYLTNKITTEVMAANVTIINTKYYNSSISTGSGIIFKKEQSGSSYKYYALTNNHVVANTGTNFKYSIEDYKGNTYTEADNSVNLVGSSPDYDLAVITFITDAELYVIDMHDTDPSVGTKVVALGQPQGQTNSISYGEVLKYINVSTADPTTSNITFKVIQHDAYINSGSSGGALLNTDLKLIGINYAGQFNDDGTFKTGATVQISKVKEYLNSLSISV